MADYISVQSGEWNESATWGGGYPSAPGDTCTITHTVTYSISADVELGQIDIDSGGTLSFNPSADTYMEIENNTFLNINDGGLLTLGTSGSPIHKDYSVKVGFNCSSVNGAGIYSTGTGSMYAYGDLNYFGQDKETFLAYDCTNSTSITATDDMSSKWNIGDRIAIQEFEDYTNYSTQGAFTVITGFDGNIIECADAIETSFLAKGIIINLTRNVQIFKVGYVEGLWERNSTRPYIRFVAYTSSKWFSGVEFISLQSIQDPHMNDAELDAPAGSIDWCTFRNGGNGVYSVYGVEMGNCLLFSQDFGTHSTVMFHAHNCIGMNVGSMFYGCHHSEFEDNYAAHCSNDHQYPRDCIIRNQRTYSCNAYVNNGNTVDVYDSYFCYINASSGFTENCRLFNCSIGKDVDGEILQSKFIMQFSGGTYEYYDCIVEPGWAEGDGQYRENAGAFAESYHRWENYNQVQGDYRLYANFGSSIKIDADGSGSYPTQRSNGNFTISEIITKSNCGIRFNDFRPFQQQIYAQADLPRTIRYYIQSDYTNVLTSDEIWLNVYYDTTNIQSTNTVSTRSNQSDWSQYIEVTINPTQDCWVKTEIYVNTYESAKYIWIDPKPEVI